MSSRLQSLSRVLSSSHTLAEFRYGLQFTGIVMAPGVPIPSPGTPVPPSEAPTPSPDIPEIPRVPPGYPGTDPPTNVPPIPPGPDVFPPGPEIPRPSSPQPEIVPPSGAEDSAAMRGAVNMIPWGMQNQAVLWSEPELAGYLEKCGGRFGSWKKRLFLLQGHSLFYFRNEQQVQTMAPSGVIPVEGSTIKIAGSEAGTESNRLPFYIYVGSQYFGLAKRDTFALGADSPETLEVWMHMLATASYSRNVLYGKLWKARNRVGELKGFLSVSSADKQIIGSAQAFKARDLQRQLSRATEEKEELSNQLAKAILEADKQDAAVGHAMVLWNMTSNLREGRSRVLHALEYEARNIENLYELMQTKGNLYQAQGVEDLRKEARMELRKLLQHAVDLLQERHAMIRARAPRYSFHVDPKIYEEPAFGGRVGAHVPRQEGRDERVNILRQRAREMHRAAEKAYRLAEKAENAYQAAERSYKLAATKKQQVKVPLYVPAKLAEDMYQKESCKISAARIPQVKAPNMSTLRSIGPKRSPKAPNTQESRRMLPLQAGCSRWREDDYPGDSVHRPTRGHATAPWHPARPEDF